MAVECKVAQLQCLGASSLADDLSWLQSQRVTHFVEEDGELVSLHGDFVGDEVQLWPKRYTWVDGGAIHLGSDDDKVRANAQWYVDAVGIPLASHTTDRLYTPTKGIPLG